MLTPSFKTTARGQKADYAQFVLEPLDQGYGHTLGNALRRVLLTSLEGAAITEIIIAGVKHQFSTLKGLKEDVAELILNLKQVRIAYQGTKEEELTLKATGPKQVTAADIKTPATVKIVNPDQPLASLANRQAKLDIKMKVEHGLGYSLAEERKTNAIGVIPIDALFTPVVKVAYNVESTRVGRRTDFDKLILEIWTDGTIKPKEAFYQAAQILEKHLRQIYKPVFKKVKKAKATVETNEAYNLTVEELDLPTRIANALRRGGYKTINDLVQATVDDLAKVKNLGEKSITKIQKMLKKKETSLKEAE